MVIDDGKVKFLAWCWKLGAQKVQTECENIHLSIDLHDNDVNSSHVTENILLGSQCFRTDK